MAVPVEDVRDLGGLDLTARRLGSGTGGRGGFGSHRCLEWAEQCGKGCGVGFGRGFGVGDDRGGGSGDGGWCAFGQAVGFEGGYSCADLEGLKNKGKLERRRSMGFPPGLFSRLGFRAERGMADSTMNGAE